MDVRKRKQIHSQSSTEVPEPFRNEVAMVVVGNGQSGQDISMELVNVAKEIHFSVKDHTEGLSKVISNHAYLHLHPQIEFVHEDGRVLFIDGSWAIADTIIYSTG